jgi:hypothetical protein
VVLGRCALICDISINVIIGFVSSISYIYSNICYDKHHFHIKEYDLTIRGMCVCFESQNEVRII